MAKPSSREVVLPVPRGYRTEVQTKSNVWDDPAGHGPDIEGVVPAVRGRVGGRSRDARSCAHVFGHSTEVHVAHTVGKLKGKSAIMIHQKYGRARNFVGLNFWSRGYCVSTVGLDEAVILEYIRTQEEREKKEEQLQLGY